jgi:hypothetical protein
MQRSPFPPPRPFFNELVLSLKIEQCYTYGTFLNGILVTGRRGNLRFLAVAEITGGKRFSLTGFLYLIPYNFPVGKIL